MHLYHIFEGYYIHFEVRGPFSCLDTLDRHAQSKWMPPRLQTTTPSTTTRCLPKSLCWLRGIEFKHMISMLFFFFGFNIRLGFHFKTSICCSSGLSQVGPLGPECIRWSYTFLVISPGICICMYIYICISCIIVGVGYWSWLSNIIVISKMDRLFWCAQSSLALVLSPLSDWCLDWHQSKSPKNLSIS